MTRMVCVGHRSRLVGRGGRPGAGPAPARGRWRRPRGSSCGPRWGSIPTTPSTGWTPSTTCWRPSSAPGPAPAPGGSAGRRWWWASASAVSTTTTTTRPGPVQREAFALQVELAHRHGLALVIHTREAWDDTFDILSAGGVPDRTVIHCFTGGPDEARRCLDLGASLSFSGVVTFKNAGRGPGGRRPLPDGPAAGGDGRSVPDPGAPSRNPQRTIEGSAGRSGDCPGQRG